MMPHARDYRLIVYLY